MLRTIKNSCPSSPQWTVNRGWTAACRTPYRLDVPFRFSMVYWDWMLLGISYAGRTCWKSVGLVTRESIFQIPIVCHRVRVSDRACERWSLTSPYVDETTVQWSRGLQWWTGCTLYTMNHIFRELKFPLRKSIHQPNGYFIRTCLVLSSLNLRIIQLFSSIGNPIFEKFSSVEFLQP